MGHGMAHGGQWLTTSNLNGNYANIAMRELSARELGHFTHHIQIG
jgi:hypothetical protein